jgi:mannose-1-phosphate guanylyltransferase/mannose-6-phosphate isomerase
MQNLIIPVILSGGSGTRLWPLSRKQHPKQYLPLLGSNTMLQETILRLNGLEYLVDPIIVCNVSHRFLVAEQCQQIGIENPTILLEPVSKNTAPAIAAAAFQSIKNSDKSDNSVLLVLSADHVIQDIEMFHNAINIATKQALSNKMAIFGVTPTGANTGYGYIKPSNKSENGAYKAEAFFEKPDIKTAKSYLAQGDYLWNSGMFMFKATTLIGELSNHSPDIVKAVNNSINDAVQDLDFIRLDGKAFELSPSDSIDYALMEKSDNVVVVPLDAQWNDIGAWTALYDISVKDIQGNAIKGDVITQDTTNTYINADHHMVVAIGVDNLIIVDTPDATFVATQDKVQEVKSIVESLQASGRRESTTHRKVHRPWGWYDSIEKRKNFQVKRIHVNPGGRLSLQSHKYRAEHWVVVKGEAIVTKDSNVFNLKENQSTYIPIEAQHSLENYSKKDYLEIIEVQSGSYFGEDDIVRYDDVYNRHLPEECN